MRKEKKIKAKVNESKCEIKQQTMRRKSGKWIKEKERKGEKLKSTKKSRKADIKQISTKGKWEKKINEDKNWERKEKKKGKEHIKRNASHRNKVKIWKQERIRKKKNTNKGK